MGSVERPYAIATKKVDMDKEEEIKSRRSKKD
jgi:hypothetical protein